MAAITLQRYNTITLAASTAQQLLIPGPVGPYYYLQILNLGPGNLYIKGDGTVSATDPASFELPINLSISPLVTGGLWILADAAGKASVQMVPQQ